MFCHVSLSQTYHYCVLYKLTGECYKKYRQAHGHRDKKKQKTSSLRRAHNNTKKVMYFAAQPAK